MELPKQPGKTHEPLIKTYPTSKEQRPDTPWRRHVYEIIFEADTPGGKAFDVALLISIVLSVIAVLLESVSEVRQDYGSLLTAIEWVFTILFSIEYVLRLVSVLHPLKYATSFFGLVDLLAVIPTYVSLLVAGTHALLVVRVFRLLRLFRVFKLTRYLGEARVLSRALKSSRYKITVFLLVVLTVVVIVGAVMYLIEGPENGFTSIPKGIYWAIVTMTTVGYGDIAPRSILGQILAAALMIMGYGIIAVPTGIVSVELAEAARQKHSLQTCHGCGAESHDDDAKYCKHCGTQLLAR